MARVVVEANTNEDSARIQQEIEDKAALLVRFDLHRDEGECERLPKEDTSWSVLPADNATEQDSEAAKRACEEAHENRDQSDQGSEAEQEHYIVMRSVLEEIEASAAEPTSELLDRLIDVPEVEDFESGKASPEDLISIDVETHPALCAHLRSFLGEENCNQLLDTKARAEEEHKSS
eukprot:TRINITY_DN64524_c0_g1_i1.p1 TRINITY_DN64524_c0_g1~~TRINITY_DN64524_c0_g1_i1.p1  ORF type:complete len:177 (+),score=44.08 TRINITY_DN64524_c0_g1_i1:84-614(+)